MSLEKLQTERVNLSGMMLEVNESIQNTEQQLVESFTGKADTDKLSDKLAQLQAKRGSLAKAISSTDKSITEENERIAKDSKQAELETRKQHVKKALESIEKAKKLQEQLAQELTNVLRHNGQAVFANHSEIERSIRGIVGRLANEFHLHGGLQLSNTISIPTTADYDRLSSVLK